MPETSTARRRNPGLRPALLVLTVALALHAGFMTVGWNSSGLVGQEFRQTQTAISCLFVQRDGYQIAYPTPILGKPWSAPMEFPFYQWAVAAWANATGDPIYRAGRSVSVLCFYAALPALFLLFRRLRLPAPQACLALAFIVTSPIYIFYTRGVLIESLALAAVAWHLVFVIRVIDGPRHLWGPVAGAWIFGAVAILTKITTWLGWMLPAMALTVFLIVQALRLDRKNGSVAIAIAGRALLATVPVFIVGLLWTHEADRLKALNPAATFLLSENLREWNFGTLSLRLSADFWRSVWQNVTEFQLAPALLLVALPLLVWQRGSWRLVAWTLGPFLGTLMTFTNLYHLHDYYYYAIAAFVVAAAALVIIRLFDDRRVPRWAAWSACLLGLTLQLGAYYRGYYQTQRIDFYGGNGLTQAIKSVTGPEDVILIYGDDWASMIPYYSERRALMIPGWREHDEASVQESIRLLQGEKVTLMLMRGNSRGMLSTIEARGRDLDINPQRIFSHEPTGVDVYVRRSDSERISKQIADGTYHGVALHHRPSDTRAPAEPNQLTLVTEEARRAYFFMMEPAPKLYAIPYDLMVYDAATPRPRFSAHAPTTLIFDLPAEARTVSGTFGVLEGAYQEGSTKGVAFEVLARRPGSEDLLLFESFLEPRFTPSDRGPKTFSVAIPDGYEGAEVVVRNRAGPTGDASFGWGYFERIVIE